MSDVLSDLADLFPDEITGQRVTRDALGAPTPTGDPVTLAARFEGGAEVVRTPAGQDITASLRAIVAGTPGFDPVSWRFTLPSRFTPHLDVEAVAVVKEADEDGPCYEEVLFR